MLLQLQPLVDSKSCVHFFVLARTLSLQGHCPWFYALCQGNCLTHFFVVKQFSHRRSTFFDKRMWPDLHNNTSYLGEKNGCIHCFWGVSFIYRDRGGWTRVFKIEPGDHRQRPSNRSTRIQHSLELYEGRWRSWSSILRKNTRSSSASLLNKGESSTTVNPSRFRPNEATRCATSTLTMYCCRGLV